MAASRRAGFATSQPGTDLEAQERENDSAIAAMGDRVSELRKLTYGIKSEVDSQNNVLDNMGDLMTRARFGLGGAVTRFKRVFHEPRSRNTFFIVIGAVVLLFVIYLIIAHSLGSSDTARACT
ncbi:hypothetical protein WJX73_002855 [Symbiochloris irregularis]|uniref:t-SNARE coiled-coil homology domain-containing protein n=1 Tax=Symbiochloris irregularis TaxID=706552 RepID=A0AAW1P1L8_9CHLO